VAEDGTTSITFEAGDVDGTVVTTATAANGTVEVNGDGTISYTPDANYNGTDTITVTATDDDGATTVSASLTSLPVMADVLIVVAPSSSVAVTVMVSVPL
jgi:hypothetical protein